MSLVSGAQNLHNASPFSQKEEKTLCLFYFLLSKNGSVLFEGLPYTKYYFERLPKMPIFKGGMHDITVCTICG
jgi:hypothetical protein